MWVIYLGSVLRVGFYIKFINICLLITKFMWVDSEQDISFLDKFLFSIIEYERPICF